MAKYGEPWRIDSSMCGDYIQTDTGAVASIYQMDRAERAIACANALAEIENPEAIPDAIAVLRTIDTWRSTGMDFPFEWLANALAALGKTRKEQ